MILRYRRDIMKGFCRLNGSRPARQAYFTTWRLFRGFKPAGQAYFTVRRLFRGFKPARQAYFPAWRLFRGFKPARQAYFTAWRLFRRLSRLGRLISRFGACFGDYAG
jgi:hypothetical protein